LCKQNGICLYLPTGVKHNYFTSIRTVKVKEKFLVSAVVILLMFSTGCATNYWGRAVRAGVQCGDYVKKNREE
jgi:hypothetical protein